MFGKEKDDLSRKPGLRSYEINWDSVLNAIYLLDGYRIGICYDPKALDKSAKQGTMGRASSENWKTLRPVLYRIASAHGNPPDVLRLMNIQRAMGNVTRLSLIPLVGLFFASQFLKLAWLFPYVFLYGFMIPPLFIISKQYTSSQVTKKIRRFYQDHPDKFHDQKETIKREIQRLIDMVVSHIKETKDQAKKYRIKVKQPDYLNIQVLKKPGRFRMDYVVAPKIE